MTTLLAILSITLLATLPESKSVLPTLSGSDQSVLEKVDVFEAGKFYPVASDVGTGSACSPPTPLSIVRPEEEGTYPVILFHHGTGCQNSWYTDVFKFISSHGYIVVAPQFYSWIQFYRWIQPSAKWETDLAAEVANWLPSGLQCVLPENIEGDLHNQLALAGHSRGGYIAFALALGLARGSPDINFSAVIGVDPVAGPSKNNPLEPKILHNEPCSLNLSIPVAIIGTGMGNKHAPFMPLVCAPDGLSHKEFFNDCKPPCSHFVTTAYGHMDMLNDDIGPIGNFARSICKGCERSAARDPMRRTVGGLFVAFLEAFLKDNYKDYHQILRKPNSYAPVVLNPVQNKSSTASCSSSMAISMPAASAFE